MSNSVWPQRQQPTRLLRPWDSPGKNTGVGCHFLLQCMKVKRENEVAQSCPTLPDPMDCSLLGSYVHGIFQARGLECGAITFSVDCRHTLTWALRKGSSGCENRMLAPDRWGAYERNDFSEPRLLHLPVHRKALNSLTQDIWFSLTIIFWYSDHLLFVTKFSVTWPLPSPPGSSSQSYLRWCLLGLKP